MSTLEKRRVYLRMGDSYAPLAWVAETNLNELLFGIRGADSKEPLYAGRFPDRRVTTEELSRGIACSFGDFEGVGLVADHFTVHLDGTFHLKRCSRPGDTYSDKVFSSPIDRTTQRFLDILVFADRVGGYRQERPKKPYVSMMVEPDVYVSFRVWISGADFDLGGVVEREARRREAVRGIRLGNFNVALEVQGNRLSDEVAAQRPSGTFVQFRWLLGSDLHLLKTFHFT